MPPTKFCKICFQEIHDYSLHHLISRSNYQICEKCFAKLEPKFIHFKLSNINALSIYSYDQTIKDLIYKFKGCYDIELKDVFLTRYVNVLKHKYKGYKIVPLPSYEKDDLRRGFNHIIEIYSRFNLDILKVLYKINNEKQAKKTRIERMNVLKNFEIRDIEKIKNQKILIVDDVYTTGSSVNAAITLIKKGKPKKIEVLVLAKNIEKH